MNLRPIVFRFSGILELGISETVVINVNKRVAVTLDIGD